MHQCLSCRLQARPTSHFAQHVKSAGISKIVSYPAMLCMVCLDLEAQVSLYGGWLAQTGNIGESSGDAPRSNASMVRVLDASVTITLRYAWRIRSMLLPAHDSSLSEHASRAVRIVSPTAGLTNAQSQSNRVIFCDSVHVLGSLRGLMPLSQRMASLPVSELASGVGVF